MTTPSTARRPHWIHSSACRGAAAEFIVLPGDLDLIENAKRFCDVCPVVKECGQLALDIKPEGVFAGVYIPPPLDKWSRKRRAAFAVIADRMNGPRRRGAAVRERWVRTT